MFEAGRARHGALQDGRHRAGDRVPVAERHQEGLVPGGQLAPGGPVGLRGRVVGRRWDQPGHGPDRGGVGRIREWRLVGGQDLGRERGLAAGLHQPGYAQRRSGADDLPEPQPDFRHRLVTGGQPGVGRHHPGEPVRVLGHQPQADQAAPVLPDQGQRVQIEPVEGKRADPFHVPRVAVIIDLGRLVRTAEPDQVGRDRPQPGIGEHRHDLAVQERPARLAVQQQHRFAARRPGFHVGQPQAADLGVPRRVAEAGQISETVLRSAQHLHDRDPTW